MREFTAKLSVFTVAVALATGGLGCETKQAVPTAGLVGAVLDVSGPVFAENSNGRRVLEKGSDIRHEDTVITEGGGQVTIRLHHNGARWSFGEHQRRRPHESDAWKVVASPVADDDLEPLEQTTTAGRTVEPAVVETEATGHHEETVAAPEPTVEAASEPIPEPAKAESRAPADRPPPPPQPAPTPSRAPRSGGGLTPRSPPQGKDDQVTKKTAKTSFGLSKAPADAPSPAPKPESEQAPTPPPAKLRLVSASRDKAIGRGELLNALAECYPSSRGPAKSGVQLSLTMDIDSDGKFAKFTKVDLNEMPLYQCLRRKIQSATFVETARKHENQVRFTYRWE